MNMKRLHYDSVQQYSKLEAETGQVPDQQLYTHQSDVRHVICMLMQETNKTVALCNEFRLQWHE